VSKVTVYDESNSGRCWTSHWRGGDYNQQTNTWVRGKGTFERFNVANNINDECGDQSGDMIVRDPLQGRSNITTRVQRSTTPCMRIDDNNQLTRSSCFSNAIMCKRSGGCPFSHVYFYCRTITETFEYILMCSTFTDNRCINHSTSTDVICDTCCSSDNCDQPGGLPACSAKRGVEDTSTRKLQMIVSMKRFEQYRSDYPRSAAGVEQGAQISLEYHGKTCTTSVLPTAVPWRCKKNANNCTESVPQKVHLNTKATLGSCWDEDISLGSDPMTIKLKLPSGSPIVVSSVRVYDEADESRCWTSDWRSCFGNYNQQTNDWVDGHLRALYGDANNFDDECTPIY